MTDKAKWTCDVCTYENWPAAHKCVMCKVGSSPSCEIYKIAENTVSANAASTAAADAQPVKVSASNVCNKWACTTCTYLNWPKSQRCVQCQSLQPQLSTTVTPVSDSMVKSSTCNISRSNNSQPSSPIPSNKPEAHNERNRRTLKWTCQACCYDNWPKSLKCILCGNWRSSDKIIERPSTPESPVQAAGCNGISLDSTWMAACQGIVSGNCASVQAYIKDGGSPSRQLTQEECHVLGRQSVFTPGHTLIHLAVRFQKQDILKMLLTDTKAHKNMPCMINSSTVTQIQRALSLSLVQPKSKFPCYLMTNIATFCLPAEIEEFPSNVRQKIYSDIIDQGVQHDLEMEEPVINWSAEISSQLNSRLYPLWNRTAGDCLLDSALQATWGIFDRECLLRRALADSLLDASSRFFKRWKDAEAYQAEVLHFTVAESQWIRDWETILQIAGQPGASLEQVHIFVLAHILRRPIIVYGIKYYKSFQGENIDLAKFQGVYLPLLWDAKDCWKSPICLGYTRGHFSALVTIAADVDGTLGAGAPTNNSNEATVYLPLVDVEGKLLPVHYMNSNQLGHEEEEMKVWLDCCFTPSGVFVAQQKQQSTELTKKMLDEWLEKYRCMPSTMDVNKPAIQNSLE